jgi:16S rRNA (adenine1518-N6/adenine1519-N6)-dimethyltransferase
MRSQRQRLGQHFLVDRGVARDIATCLPEVPAQVIEIGPGKGALTSHLLERFPRVRAIELDERLAGSLSARLGRPPGLEVLRSDALSVGLEELAAGGPWSVAGNLPYSVGTPIIRRLLPRCDLFSSLVVMVQQEVAERLVAAPGSSARGLLTLEVEAFSRAELLFTVSRRCFEPPPKVTSAVVRLVLTPPEVDRSTPRRALALAATAFTHKRKKLGNALAAAVVRTDLLEAADRAGVSLDQRPQELSLMHWFALAIALSTVVQDEP